jgi:hypothetical protein
LAIEGLSALSFMGSLPSGDFFVELAIHLKDCMPDAMFMIDTRAHRPSAGASATMPSG